MHRSELFDFGRPAREDSRKIEADYFRVFRMTKNESDEAVGLAVARSQWKLASANSVMPGSIGIQDTEGSSLSIRALLLWIAFVPSWRCVDDCKIFVYLNKYCILMRLIKLRLAGHRMNPLKAIRSFHEINGSAQLGFATCSCKHKAFRTLILLSTMYLTFTVASPALAQSTAPIGLGVISGSGPSSTSSASGINSDGSVVVGTSSTSASQSEAFRWTQATGMTGLGFLFVGPNASSAASGTNSDGSVVVGSSGNGSTVEAFRWTQAMGMVGLGFLNVGGNSTATAVNSDGSVVVGQAFSVGSGLFLGSNEAYRWTQATGMVGLGYINPAVGPFAVNFSTANGVNSDGSVVVGASSYSAATASVEAFRWTQAMGMVGLGFLNVGGNSVANAVNSDGSVVVGFSSDTSNKVEAFRWTQATGMVGLGFINTSDGFSRANAVNSDGSVVVGIGGPGLNNYQAFRWTQNTGMQSLSGLLSAAGVNMTGIQLLTAQGVSSNGQYIVGQGTGLSSIFSEAYIVRYVDATPTVGGVTTPDSVRNSVNQLADAQNGALAQQQSLMWYLLFRGDAVSDSATRVGAFAEGGSAMGGVRGGINLGHGFTILGGLAVGQESYASARVGTSPWGALAGRYVVETAAPVRPFVEIGGWLAPGAPFNFSRSYLNGAGTVTATGNTSGSISYFYGRAGAINFLSPADEFDPAVELGQARLSAGGYTEALSAANPFPASVDGGATAMTIGKIEGTWTHRFTPVFSGSLYGAYAHGWSNQSGVVAVVGGVGTFSAVGPSNLDWLEYGLQLGYRVSANVEINGFADGMAGRNSVGAKLHTGIGVNVKF